MATTNNAATEQGICFPASADGSRSTTRTGAEILATSLSALSAEQASAQSGLDAAWAAMEWRFGAQRCIAHPEWFDLADRTPVLLGAGSHAIPWRSLAQNIRGAVGCDFAGLFAQ